MLLSHHSKLADLLIMQLAAQPDQRALELRRGVTRRGRSFSQAAVYKELGALKTQGVVVKQRDRYSLSFTWLTELQQFTESVNRRYRAPDYLTSFLPSAVGRHVWNFTTLMGADDFWNQILLVLVSQAAEPLIFSWVPHPWFVLIHTAKERKLHAALGLQAKQLYTIFGGDSYLDRLAERLYQRPLHTYAFAPGPFESQRDTYIDVVGDYVLMVRIGGPLVHKIETLFRVTRSKRDLDPLHITQLLAARARVTLTLERNSLRAAKLRKKFQDYFGLARGP